MLVIGVFKLLFVSYLIDFTCLRLISACLLELVGLGLYTWVCLFVFVCSVVCLGYLH